MSSLSQSISTHDLRSAAVDYKRDSEQKHKWALGERSKNAHRDMDRDNRKPVRISQRVNAACRRTSGQSLAKKEHRAETACKRDIHSEQHDRSGDNTSADDDESVRESSAAPEPDAEIAYSYDASRGPSKGSQILGLAIAQAVERFEDQETTKLVKREYEVLDSDLDNDDGDSRNGGGVGSVEEDDFELL